VQIGIREARAFVVLDKPYHARVATAAFGELRSELGVMNCQLHAVPDSRSSRACHPGQRAWREALQEDFQNSVGESDISLLVCLADVVQQSCKDEVAVLRIGAFQLDRDAYEMSAIVDREATEEDLGFGREVVPSDIILGGISDRSQAEPDLMNASAPPRIVVGH
jgi:hypothetical protein